MLAEGKYPIELVRKARGRKDWSLVTRQYTARDGSQAEKNSITFNPFLKTKLLGVLAPSFLRSGKVLVNGQRMGAAKRLAFAESLGFKADRFTKAKDEVSEEEGEVDSLSQAVFDFLFATGNTVDIQRSKYATAYYDYKLRLENSPKHADKSKGHRHNMALRFMLKLFLHDYYNVARRLEGLVVAKTYAESVLGLTHGVASEEKNNLVRH